ncbi:hypothetical protein GCM10009869_01240 [Amnibacterium kyonggiense]
MLQHRHRACDRPRRGLVDDRDEHVVARERSLEPALRRRAPPRIGGVLPHRVEHRRAERDERRRIGGDGEASGRGHRTILAAPTSGVRQDVAVRSLLGLNAALAFLLELALLVAAVAIGLLLPAPLAVRIVVAVVLPVLVIAFWAVAMAPRAPRRLAPSRRLIAQTVLFALAVVGLAVVGQVVWALVLAVLVAVRIALGVRVGRI